MRDGERERRMEGQGRTYTSLEPSHKSHSHIPGHGFWQATSRSVLTQEPVLQVDPGLSDDVIRGEPIPVHHRHLEGVVYRQLGRQLKHLPKERIQFSCDVVLFVVDRLLPDGDLEVRIRLPIGVLRLEVDALREGYVSY